MPITAPVRVAKGIKSSHWSGLGHVPPLKQGGGVSCGSLWSSAKTGSAARRQPKRKHPERKETEVAPVPRIYPSPNLLFSISMNSITINSPVLKARKLQITLFFFPSSVGYGNWRYVAKSSQLEVQPQPSSCLTPTLPFTAHSAALRTLEQRRHDAHFMKQYSEAKTS